MLGKPFRRTMLELLSMTRLHPRVAALAFIFAAHGCDDRKAADAARADPAGAASASASLDMKKIVLKTDCTAWSEHAVSVLLTEWKASASDCPEAERTALGAKLDGERASLRDAATDACSKHLNESYASHDARCYLDGKSMRELADCKLAAMATGGDSELVAEFTKQRAFCASRGGGAQPASSK